MREKIFAARQQARDLLFGQSVDRAGIEKLRSEQIGTVDALSKRLTQALADAAEVLTPEQRRKLEGLLPPVGGWRGRVSWMTVIKTDSVAKTIRISASFRSPSARKITPPPRSNASIGSRRTSVTIRNGVRSASRNSTSKPR